MRIDDYIKQRNDIQFRAEKNQRIAHIVWTELGVANRHIRRVIDGELPLAWVESEIKACLKRASELNFRGEVW